MSIPLQEIERIISDAEIYHLLGPERFGSLIRLSTIAVAQQDLPGGYAVVANMDNVGRLLGIGNRKRAEPMVAALEAVGFVWRQYGENQGRRVGKFPSRVWLTFGGLTDPRGGARQGALASHHFAMVQKAPVQNGPMKNTHHLIAIPSQKAEIITGPKSNDANWVNVQSTDNEINSSSLKENTDPKPTSGSGSTPAIIDEALKRIGWIGSPPQGQDWAVVAALVSYLEQQPVGRYAKPAAWLRTVLNKEGEAEAFLAGLGISTPREVTQSTFTEAVMSMSQWVEMSISDPEWEQVVKIEAKRRASSTGEVFSMLLVRTVAKEWEHRHLESNGQTGENPF